MIHPEPKAKKSSGEEGFTLVEALVAMVVLIFGLMAVTNLMVVAASSNSVANQSTAAAAAASQVLDTLRATAWGDVNVGGTLTPTGPAGVDCQALSDASGSPPVPLVATTFACFSDMPGVGRVLVNWQISAVTGSTNLVFIEVQAEGTERLEPGAREPTLRRSEAALLPRAVDMNVAVVRMQDPRRLTNDSTLGTGERNMGNGCRERQKGFSLVELMVAITITVIITGAIYGLVTAGGNAFQREPEIADRQQSIRIAMDAISRDVLVAGQGVPPFAQVFTRLDPSGGSCSTALNGCGPTGSMGTAAATARSDTDVDTDVLEMLGVEETCPALRVCSGNAAAAGVSLVTREVIPTCMAESLPGIGLTTNGTAFAFQALIPLGSTATAGPCPGVSSDFHNGGVTAAAGAAGGGIGGWNNAGASFPSTTNPVFLYAARIVRYRIAPGPDPGNPAPALWRSTTGRFTTAGAVATEPGETGFDPANSPWRVVAQGIEDLQVEYYAGSTWSNVPPENVVPTGTPDYATLVQQVRITLSARVSAAGGNTLMQGATDPGAGGAGPTAIRGQLVSVVAPRRTGAYLQLEGNKL